MANRRFDQDHTDHRPSRDYSYSSWFLVELEQELVCVSTSLRDATLIEVQEHLECSRMALEEVGVPSHECDKEAVRRFGSPGAFAQQVIESHTRADGRSQNLLRWLTVVTILALVTFPSLLIYQINVMCGILYIALPIFIMLSWRSRTFQWKSLGTVCALASLGFGLFLGFAWVSLWSFGGMGEAPRWKIRSFVEAARESLNSIPAAIKQCDPISKAFSNGVDEVKMASYYRNGRFAMYEIGHEMRGPLTPDYKIVWTSDFDLAKESWQHYQTDRRLWMDGYADSQRNVPALQQASGSVFDPNTAAEGLAAVAGMSCVALMLNFIICVLRRIYDLFRRRSRRLFA